MCQAGTQACRHVVVCCVAFSDDRRCCGWCGNYTAGCPCLYTCLYAVFMFPTDSLIYCTSYSRALFSSTHVAISNRVSRVETCLPHDHALHQCRPPTVLQICCAVSRLAAVKSSIPAPTCARLHHLRTGTLVPLYPQHALHLSYQLLAYSSSNSGALRSVMDTRDQSARITTRSMRLAALVGGCSIETQVMMALFACMFAGTLVAMRQA